jgi:uncharacterized protein DUF4331
MWTPAGGPPTKEKPMSHHLDSPASRRDPRLNLTDLYVFDGDAGTVLALAVNTSLAGADRVPGFHPEARYEFRVHLDGAPQESLTYRVAFGERDGTGTQAVTLSRLTGEDARGDGAAGTVLAQGRTGTTVTGPGGLRLWAGAAADPFYLDLHQLAHVLEGLQNSKPIELGEWAATDAASTFAGSEVYAIVLEVPSTDATLTAGRDVDVWATTKLATDAGGWRQINRTGIPMVWPLFRALGDSDDSSEYAADTTGHPAEDRARDGARITEFVAAASRSTGLADPEAYGRLVAERLLPDLLPYRVGTPAAFSFAGANGRALADNAPEVVYGLITNSAFPTGLTPAAAAGTRQEHFPYVVPSVSG